MSETIQMRDGDQISIDRRPSKCPMCHHAIRSISRQDFTAPANLNIADVVFECPNCLRLFIAHYALDYGRSIWLLRSASPARTRSVALGAIDSVSPTGLKIYNQAIAAEAYNLDEIAGVAYRRALEFFVKDFCIKIHPTAADAIKQQHKLGVVIETYVDDPKLKKAAKMTAWLGNDETHYERRWETKDISDLKKLLSIVVNSINEAIELTAYESEMMPASNP